MAQAKKYYTFFKRELKSNTADSFALSKLYMDEKFKEIRSN